MRVSSQAIKSTPRKTLIARNVISCKLPIGVDTIYNVPIPADYTMPAGRQVTTKQFMMGNDILAQAAFDVGAEIMFGYPITPTTEVLATWVKLAEKNNKKYLQTEDEGAAGFGVCGAVLAGHKAFTATAGPGTILMQDPLVMAEAMRLPMVVFVGQRGGPSTGQVIYSQQEVTMAAFGGNGEGLRVVYSTSSLQDLYNYAIKAFNTAWKYRFPTILLYDGYQGKMKGAVDFNTQQATSNTPQAESILTTNMRNTYNQEEEIGELVLKYKEEFDRVTSEIVEYEAVNADDAQIMIVVHGIVAACARVAIENLRKQGISVGLFRPITLWPFPKQAALQTLQKAKRIITFESSLGQMARILERELWGLNLPVTEVNKPAVGFTPEEIEEKVKNLVQNG